MRRVLCFALGIGALPGARVEAQPSQPAWEVEVHGGAMTGSTPDKGDLAMPALNATVPPNFQRPVSSWYFGDGSFQLNQFLNVRQSAPIEPLDGTLQRRVATRQSGGAFGARIARRITGRLSAELAIDYATGSLALTNDARSAFEATRANFIPALNAFLTGGLIASRTANSTLTITDEQGAQVVTTGAVRFDLVRTRNWAPYVVAGVGALSIVGDSPQAVLTGSYQAVISVSGLPIPPATFSQTDTVTISSTVEPSTVWLLGGGVRFWMSERWGIRIDVSDHMHGNTLTTKVSAGPTPPPATFGTYVTAVLNAPPIVFSGSPTAGSTLSVPLSDFVTFNGRGVAHQVSLTTGFVWRF
jgi:hypothetical protein